MKPSDKQLLSPKDMQIVIDHLRANGYADIEAAPEHAVELTQQGRSRDTYKLNTIMDGAKKVFIVSINNLEHTTKEVTAIQIQNLMAENGVNAPPIIGGIGHISDERSFQVTPYIQHQTLDRLTPEIAKNIGAELAKVHIVGQTISRNPDIDFSNNLPPEPPIARKVNEIKLKASRLATVCVNGNGPDWSLVPKHYYNKFFNKVRLDPNIPKGITHGDFHLDNVLVDDDGQAHIIDWELVKRNPLIKELAAATFALSTNAPDAHDPFDTTIAQAFLEGYNSERPLTPAEADIWPDYFQRKIHQESVYNPLMHDHEDKNSWRATMDAVDTWIAETDFSTILGDKKQQGMGR